MKFLVPFFLVCLSVLKTECLQSQNTIGHVSRTFVDTDRDNRNVSCEIFYPADTNGDEVAVATGTFPLLIFGHGFVMDYSAYQNLWEALVPEAYVMAFLTTEGGFLPSHNALALDMSFILSSMMDENLESNSLFYSSLTEKQAFIGHSMGGGCAWLAANTDTEVDCVVGLAPAETTPSAIISAFDVDIPAMVFSGSADNVTPPASNHLPIYENTNSTCKILVTLEEGSHCGYANEGSICNLGEIGFNGMTRERQQQITQELLLPWLNYQLKNMTTDFTTISGYAEQNTDASLNINCIISTKNYSWKNYKIWPNPFQEKVNWQIDNVRSGESATITFYNALGSKIHSEKTNHDGSYFLETANLAKGIYMVTIESNKLFYSTRLIKN